MAKTSCRSQRLRCLITGGSGFIGSHLAERLLGRGHEVSVVDDLSTGRLENIYHLQKHARFRFARASIADRTVMDRLGSQADVIFHLAAAVGVKLIVERPVHTIVNNVMGTESVLQVAQRYGTRVLVASSSEVYGKSAAIPFHEDDDVRLGPTCRFRWAYSASKMVDEFLSLAYQREYGLPVVAVRMFNTVGPRQTGAYGMVIPRFVGQALRNEALTVHGDGQQTRCFCHVQDVAEALIGLALHPDAPGRVYNIGSTEELSIHALAERVIHLARSKSKVRLVPYAEAYAEGFEDMPRRRPDISRIQKLLGWRPRKGLDLILREVIAHERRRNDA